MEVWILVVLVAMAVFAVGAGLIMLDHYCEMKRTKKIGKIVGDNVIPSLETALEVYTQSMLDAMKEMMKEMKDQFM